MIAKFFNGVKVQLIAAFKSITYNECAECHHIIRPGDYFTRTVEEDKEYKYCYDCRTFKKVKDAKTLSTDPLPSMAFKSGVDNMALYRAQYSESAETRMAEFQAQGQRELEELLAYERHTEPNTLNELSPLVDRAIQQMSPGDTPKNVHAIRLPSLTPEEIVELPTAKLPASRVRREQKGIQRLA